MAETNSNLSIVVRVRDEATSALRSLSNDVSDLGGNLNFAGDKAGILAGALASIGAATVLKTSIQAFAESEAQMARFGAIMKTLPPDLQAFKGQILDTADNALLKFGFDNESAAISMARLMQATNSGTLTFAGFQAAMDLARFKGIGLEEATQALILAFGGNARLLKQFGIDVDEHASKETILAAVTKSLAGQSEAYSHTLAGQIEIGKQVIGEFSEALGGVFAPAIEFAIGWIMKIIDHFGGLNATIEKFKPLIIWFAAFLAGTFVAGAILAVTAILGMIGASASLIIAIASLATILAAFIVFWENNWAQARATLELFKIGAQAIWSSITGYISNQFSSAMNNVRNQLQNVLDFFNSVVSIVTQPIKTAINTAGSIGRAIGLAEGGIVTQPTLAMIGEGGESEAVIPLSRLGGIGGGSGVNIYLQGDFYTEKESAERWANEIAKIIKYQVRLSLT